MRRGVFVSGCYFGTEGSLDQVLIRQRVSASWLCYLIYVWIGTADTFPLWFPRKSAASLIDPFPYLVLGGGERIPSSRCPLLGRVPYLFATFNVRWSLARVLDQGSVVRRTLVATELGSVDVLLVSWRV